MPGLRLHSILPLQNMIQGVNEQSHPTTQNILSLLVSLRSRPATGKILQCPGSSTHLHATPTRDTATAKLGPAAAEESNLGQRCDIPQGRRISPSQALLESGREDANDLGKPAPGWWNHLSSQ